MSDICKKFNIYKNYSKIKQFFFPAGSKRLIIAKKIVRIFKKWLSKKPRNENPQRNEFPQISLTKDVDPA